MTMPAATAPAEPTLRLWAAPGACSRISITALLMCGVPFQLVPVALAQGQQRQADFLALNPKGKVPVLQTSHGLLSETLAIISWLEACHPGAGLLPPAHQAWARAQAVSWLAFANAGLHPLIYRLRMPRRIHADEHTHAGVHAAALAELMQQLLVAEQALAGAPWLGGEQANIADAALGWAFGRATLSGLPGTQFPNLQAHAERLHVWPVHARAVQAEAALA
jgi:glutathione S-transferase